MAKYDALADKVWQIHDVLHMTLNAIEGCYTRDELPIHGVICMLMEQCGDVANKLSDPAYAGDDVRHDKTARDSKEDA